MSKLYNEPIKLCEPKCFIWRDRSYRVKRILRQWTITKNWWNPQTAVARNYFLVNADVNEQHSGGVYEIYFSKQDKGWYLNRIYD